MTTRDRELEDDAALWARVTDMAVPLKRKDRTTHVETPPAPARARKAQAPAKKLQQATVQEPSAVPSRKNPGPPGGLDRQTARKLARGHLAVEARLDLHGMRQREAHAALRKFVRWAQGKDYRHVLVITGKGSDSETADFFDADTRGVLRQAVPHWLGQGDLAPLIVSFSEAPRRLGGGGALYVRLRKARSRAR